MISAEDRAMIDEARNAPVDYRDIQDRGDEAYKAAWRDFLVAAPYAVRAELRRLGIAAPMVDPKVDPRRKPNAEETERLEKRMASLERHDITPATLLEEKEEAKGRTRARKSADRRVEVRVRHFHLFAMFIGTGADELDAFGFEDARAAMREEARLRSSFAHRPARDYLPLSELLNGDADADEEWFARREGVTVRALRIAFFERQCEEIALQSSTLDQFAKNLAAHLRRKKPMEIAALGGTQTEVSRKFSEKRATVSAREIRVVEEPAQAAGVRGFHFLGGTKTEAHRRACATAQKGNNHRATATRRRRMAIEAAAIEDEEIREIA